MRRGITLYEVVLALAIFSGSMAAISQIIATGTRAAVQSRLQSQAMLLCQSKMAEVVSGAVPPKAGGESAFTEPGLEGWTYSITLNPGPRLGLQEVVVGVACRNAGSMVDATFSMSRWVRDQTAFLNSGTQAAEADLATKAAELQQQGTQQN